MPGVSNKTKHKSRIVTSDTHRAINVERPPLPHKSLDQVYVPIKHEDRTPASLYRNTRGYLREHFIPSGRCGKSFIKSAFPFLSWLRKYEMAWLPNDIICGITVRTPLPFVPFPSVDPFEGRHHANSTGHGLRSLGACARHHR